MTQEEKIKDLGQRVAIMSEANSELCKDLEHFKRVAAGQKGRMQQLAQDVERWKAYGKEADELNEKRIGKIEEQEKVIEGLEQQVLNLSRELSEKNTEISVLRIEVKRQSETIAHIARKPWYKRMFSKDE
jgi:chromosome segregation ATPase